MFSMLFPSEEGWARQPSRKGEGLQKPASWGFCMALSLSFLTSLCCPGCYGETHKRPGPLRVADLLPPSPSGTLGCFLDAAGQVLGLWWNQMPGFNQHSTRVTVLRELSERRSLPQRAWAALT